jgi:Tol biopolymer transport system component
MAFYAGARYVEIPVAPYDDTIASLAADGVEWLSLHRLSIHPLRPALRPLMYSRAVMNGELRYEQVFFQPAGEMVFRHRLDRDPIEYTQLTTAPKADIMPAWSPDGERLAFRRQRDDGTVSLVVASRRNRARAWSEENMELVEVAPLDDLRDPLAWSPDGERIAFARQNLATGTDYDLYVIDVYSGAVAVLVSSPADERSPSWPANGRVVFARESNDRSDVWTVSPETRVEEQLTNIGTCHYPVSDPDGRRVAWITEGRGVGVFDVESGQLVYVPAPHKTLYAPAWSPGGRLIAVTAADWGSYDVYLQKADGTNVLLLTKLYSGEASPAWSPDGESMVVVSNRGGTFSLWLVRGLDPYFERLNTRVELNVFEPLTERSKP